MAGEVPPGSMAIGEVLKQARQRAGLDISTVEERTKIRTRYLRALESEEWDALPGEVYTRGFLRTYAQLLGLDAEALVDEYRRRSEEPRGVGLYPISEPMLRTRRRADQTGRDWVPGRGLAIGALIVILLVVLLILGLTGGEEGSEVQEGPIASQRPAQPQSQRDADERSKPAPPPRLPLTLVAASTVQVCLLNGEGEKLFGATLTAGERREFEAYRYLLRFPGGFDLEQVKVLAGGEPLDFGLDPSGAVEYEIANSGELSGPSSPGSTTCP